MEKQVLRNKSFEFGISIMRLCSQLRREKKEYVLIKQLLRSGTAIGALVREAEYAQSRADFINKMSVALKEANETEYWIDLFCVTGVLKPGHHDKISQALKEILRLLIATIRTAKANMEKK